MIDIKSLTLVRLALEVSKGERSMSSIPTLIEKDDQFELLLMAAHGQEGTLKEVARLLEIEADKLDDIRSAALALTIHLLFKEDAEPYQVLGLTPLASMAEAKVRHQILIRLFHPDRFGNDASHSARFSAIINEAFEKIKERDRGFQSQKVNSRKIAPPPGGGEFDLRQPPILLNRSRTLQNILTPFNIIALVLAITVFVLYALYEVHQENLQMQMQNNYDRAKISEVKSMNENHQDTNTKNNLDTSVIDSQNSSTSR